MSFPGTRELALLSLIFSDSYQLTPSQVSQGQELRNSVLTHNIFWRVRICLHIRIPVVGLSAHSRLRRDDGILGRFRRKNKWFYPRRVKLKVETQCEHLKHYRTRLKTSLWASLRPFPLQMLTESSMTTCVPVCPTTPREQPCCSHLYQGSEWT